MTEADPINLSAPAAVNYLVMDNNDTTRMTVNAAGTASGFATFYPYGEPGNSATSAEYEWTNQIRDSTGVDHFWHRDYASQLARWLSPDPAGLAAVSLTNPQTWNEYAYVLNDPASATDAEGLLTTNPPYQPPTAPPWAWDDPVFRWYDIMNMMPTVEPGAPPPRPGPMGGGAKGRQSSTSPACAERSNQAKVRFLRSNYRYAQTIASELSVPPSDILGLSAFETGWGTGRIAMAANNYFSLEMGSYFAYGRLAVPPVVSGAPGHPEFGVYPAPGFLTSGQALAHSPYGPNLVGQASPGAFAQGLLKGPVFNNSPDYGGQLVNFIDEVARLLPCV